MANWGYESFGIMHVDAYLDTEPICRLLSTILDPDKAPAKELVALYHERWEIEAAFFAVRGLMHEAALRAQEDPDRLSFIHTVRVVRRKLPFFHAIPPGAEDDVS